MRIVGAISTALSFKALSISPIILSVELGSSELRFSVQLIGCAISVIIGSSFLHKRVGPFFRQSAIDMLPPRLGPRIESAGSRCWSNTVLALSRYDDRSVVKEI